MRVFLSQSSLVRAPPERETAPLEGRLHCNATARARSKEEIPGSSEELRGIRLQTTHWRPASRIGPLTFLERKTYLSLECPRAALAIVAPTLNFAELAVAELAT